MRVRLDEAHNDIITDDEVDLKQGEDNDIDTDESDDQVTPGTDNGGEEDDVDQEVEGNYDNID